MTLSIAAQIATLPKCPVCGKAPLTHSTSHGGLRPDYCRWIATIVCDHNDRHVVSVEVRRDGPTEAIALDRAVQAWVELANGKEAKP